MGDEVRLKESWDAGRVRNIMILEGDERQAEALKSFLEACGCSHVQIETAAASAEAQREIIEGPFDIVIMDYETQGLNVLCALSAAKPELFVIVIDDADLSENPVIHQYAQGFLRKGPLMRQGLVPMLRSFTEALSASPDVYQMRPGEGPGR